MRTVALVISSVAVLAVAYGGVSLWRTAGQLSQASTGLVSRVDTRSRAALPEPESVQPAGSFGAPELDPAEPAVFDEDDVANGLVPDPAFEPAESASGLEEPYVEYEEPGFATTADEGFTDPSLEQSDPDAYVDEPFPEDDPFPIEGRYDEDRTVEETFLDEPAAGEEQYAEEADPSVVLQALLNDPDPTVRDEAARILQEIETERRQSLLQ